MANEIGEVDFEDAPQDAGVTATTQELTPESFMAVGQSYLKTPQVGEEVIFKVEKVLRNEHTSGLDKNTNQKFHIGLKTKENKIMRFDLYTDLGVYTIRNWEIYFKLFGSDGILMKYSKTHNNSFKGAKISMKRLLDGGHSSTKISDLAKIIGKTEAETKVYQEEIKKAIKEQRLFEIKLIA